ncbi:hypothetical protein C731_2947 [Mycolicibacterium hassiacum DSM 44199]|uniref:Uncharacterized protein n=1 Tax=Mycolicibacterium hassiacum (strain DSM 44199 / CIP 105218 / JCM 12690 / 3849) TaxID=1122247 RepID=K5BJG0_MYCHD|nr:hypothetical protein [Mycolicibacterium hassiacum]EKF23049.1 hypothetical protein C731_2947 [Mycolicibacterium hassiacum DSM 44199]VCT89526.1 hypothetical protein MHAS_01220 [Mycolicibacterium hassiacum DSM 44199]
MTPTEWESIAPAELLVAAKVARASGGVIMSGAADAWEERALTKLLEDFFPIRYIQGAGL